MEDGARLITSDAANQPADTPSAPPPPNNPDHPSLPSTPLPRLQPQCQNGTSLREKLRIKGLFIRFSTKSQSGREMLERFGRTKEEEEEEGGGRGEVVRGCEVLGEQEKEKMGEDEGVNFSAATRPRLAPRPFTPPSPRSARHFRRRPRGRWHRGATSDGGREGWGDRHWAFRTSVSR